MGFARRHLILGLGAALGLDLPALPRWLGGRGRGAAQAAPPAPAPASAGLSATDLEDLLAFAGVLVAGARPLSPDERGHLVDHIGYRVTQGAGYYLDLYRTTVRLLDRLAGTRFSSLDTARRVEVVTRHRLAGPARPGTRRVLSEEAADTLARVVPDLVGGYYASPAGWAVVGYAVFPGRCGDLARYTRPEPS